LLWEITLCTNAFMHGRAFAVLLERGYLSGGSRALNASENSLPGANQ